MSKKSKAFWKYISVKTKTRSGITVLHCYPNDESSRLTNNDSHKPCTYSLVFPYLIYCNEVWGNASAVHLEPIIKIQKTAIRTITFSSYLSPSEPIFQSLNILNFRKLVIQRVSLLMFKISKSDVPKPLHALFRINNSYLLYV